MLEKEFDYYLKKQKQLANMYPNQYIVIVGEQVVGVYKNYEIALFESKKKMQKGSFLIQHCISGSAAYTSTFHSNVFVEDVAN